MRRSIFQWKKGFSVKRGEAIQWMGGLVRISTGKAIQWTAGLWKLKSCCPQEVVRSLPNDNKTSDNIIRKISKFYCHGISQEKECFWTIFRWFSPSPTPSKTQILLTLSFRRLWPSRKTALIPCAAQERGNRSLRKAGHRGALVSARARNWPSGISSKPFVLALYHPNRNLGCRKWGCNKWGLKGCLAALPGNRPKSAFFALFLPFLPFSGGCEETEEEGLFPQISSDFLKPPSLKPPFAALQEMVAILIFRRLYLPLRL